ncbi:MAG TPA: stage II sporulation protein M [Pirellulales bacterium]|jgi:uncharacterized membrane protein SpoIIM required for sporulation|nr:stage II sporulation protein M [Pirellulales bacterium]
MKVADLLEKRREHWRELEQLCYSMEGGRRRRLGGTGMARFTSLYRSACADLALADAYQLPPNTVTYLHHLVARAHNQLYRARRFNVQAWMVEVFRNVPRRLYSDNALRLAFVIFWGIFIASMLLARSSPEYAHELIGREAMAQYQENFSKPLTGRNPNDNFLMAGFYIWHNAGIGMQCFVYGLFAGVGGLFQTVFNAAYLGGVFGFMTTVPEKNNFFEFVTAHGPFELTAIVLAAGAGMRLGFSLLYTNGRSRLESLRAAGRESVPAIMVAVILFMLAAFIEGFISPSRLPYTIKAFVAALSSGLLMFYFIVLGQSPRETNAV